MLGLPREATPTEIKQAFRKHSRNSHPDLNPELGANTRFLEIHQAYETLIDPVKRENYDRYLEEENDAPLNFEILYSRSAILPLDEPQLLYALINISPNTRLASKTDMPLNISLVLDRSTSMQGDRLQQVKAAAIKLLRGMQSDDILSIIIFSDRAEVLLSTHNQANRDQSEKLINSIKAGGGTEIYHGLLAGFDQIILFKQRTLNNQLILVTDGHTYGDEDACYGLADRCSAQGITLTGFGIGSDWADEFMDQLVERAGGYCHFVPNAADLPDLLVKENHRIRDLFAARGTLSLEAADGVKINSVFRLQPVMSELVRHEPILIGNIQKSGHIQLLIELALDHMDRMTDRAELASGSIGITKTFEQTEFCQMPIRISRLVGQPPAEESPPQEIVLALSRINLLSNAKKAWEEVASGDFENATIRLHRLATKLVSMGEKDLAGRTLREIDQITNSQSSSAAGKKTLKYATRGLLAPSLPNKKEK